VLSNVTIGIFISDKNESTLVAQPTPIRPLLGWLWQFWSILG
jgi:hypothetical protein